MESIQANNWTDGKGVCTLISRGQEGGGDDSRSVQRPRDRGDFGAPLRGVRSEDWGSGADRLRALPGALPLAVRADLLHRLRAAGPARGSQRRRLGRVLSPSIGGGGLLE